MTDDRTTTRIPADDPAWSVVVERVYGMQRRVVRAGAATIVLFRFSLGRLSTPWVTAPFLTDGGVAVDGPIDASAVLSACEEALRETGDSEIVVRTRFPIVAEAPADV